MSSAGKGSSLIELSGVGGEVNTASNVGLTGEGLFKQKAGSNLEFKNISFDDDHISIVDDLPNNSLKVNLSQLVVNLLSFFNGTWLNSLDLAINQAGGVVTLSVQEAGGGDPTVHFSDGGYTLSAPATIDLTQGTDDDPTNNFVYLDKATKLLTINTSSFPATEHAPIAEILCQTAASVQTDAVMSFHPWDDHAISILGQGHLTHLNTWIRGRPATWLSGVDVTIGGSGTGTLTFASTAGVIRQLHDQSFPAFLAGADMFVINDPVTPYKKIQNLSDILTDSLGVSLANRTYGLVVWGNACANGPSSKIFINLPSGSEGASKPDDVRADINKYQNYSVAQGFTGTGFLDYRVVVGANAGQTVFIDYPGGGDDLRGQNPTS